MIAVLDRPRVIPFRWFGHRLDIRTTITDEHGPLFSAKDICTALGEYVGHERNPFLGITVDVFPAETVTVDELLEPDDQPIQFYRLRTVYELAENRPMWMPAADDFLGFFDTIVRNLVEPDFVEAVTHAEPGLQADTYSVVRSAAILSRDPNIKIGRDSLFDFMRNIGWVERDTDPAHTWIPTDANLRAGHLVRHHVRVPGRRSLYPQIRITETGIQELHRRLGGIARIRINEPQPLSLVELA